MDELKVPIRNVILRITKTLQKQLKRIVIFMDKVSLLTNTSETGFQSFVLRYV